MRTIRVTPDNVSAIMSALNITDDMLMTNAIAKNCKLCPSGNCQDKCNKYQLSGDRHNVGYNRGGACVLFRLRKIKDSKDCVLYAPVNLLECECEDI